MNVTVTEEPPLKNYLPNLSGFNSATNGLLVAEWTQFNVSVSLPLD